MSRQLIRDDKIPQNKLINTGNISTEDVIKALKALKSVYLNEILGGNIQILLNTIKVNNPNDRGSKIDIIAPYITLNASSKSDSKVSVTKDFVVGGNVLVVNYDTKRVGINTTSPNYSLDVSGNINFSGNLLKNGVPFTPGSDFGTPQVVGQFVEDPLPVGTIVPYTNEEVPRGWMKCDGREVERLEYSELFAVIGTTYGGGNGVSTFNLPDLRGRTILGDGVGEDLSTRILGEKGGSEVHLMTVNQLPAHSHKLLVSNSEAGLEFADLGKEDVIVGDHGGTYTSKTDITDRPFIENTGTNEPFNIMSPFLICNYIIKVRSITTDAIIISDGKVGINTDTPLATLHVNGDVLITQSLRFSSDALVFDQTGKIGIGKAPAYALDVEGDINLTGNILFNGVKVTDPVPLGTIIPYASNIVPTTWLPCDGRTLNKTLYPDLFEVIGYTYGGDNVNLFKLPDLRGRDIIGVGQGENLTNRVIGQTGGSEMHVLTIDQMPQHTHNILVSTSTAGLEFADTGKEDVLVGDHGGAYVTNTTSGTPFIKESGNDASFNIMQPYLVCNYIIKATPIQSLFGTPYNHWTKFSDNNLIYLQGSTTVANLNVNGTFKTVIITGGQFGTPANPVSGGTYIIDMTTRSNVMIELGSDNTQLIINGIVNNTTYGNKGQIIINERNIYGRSVSINNAFTFNKQERPTQTKHGINRILYEIITDSLIICTFDVLDTLKNPFNRVNGDTRLASFGTQPLSCFMYLR
jgi:microcystin-dependent protein